MHNLFLMPPGGRIVRLNRTGTSKSTPWAVQQHVVIEGGFVTWGLCHHQDGLFSAADQQYESKIYTQPPPGLPTGCVLWTKLGADGTLMQTSVFTKVRKSRCVTNHVIEVLHTELTK